MTLRVRAVSEKEREALRRMARSRTVGAGLVRRAQIVLHALEGLKAPEIGARIEPPPLKWSILRYVFGQDGGPRCRARDTSLRRSSPSCARRAGSGNPDRCDE